MLSGIAAAEGSVWADVVEVSPPLGVALALGVPVGVGVGVPDGVGEVDDGGGTKTLGEGTPVG